MIDTLFATRLEPISILFLILVQIGGRFLRFELTKAQQKLINNPIFQAVILFALAFMATKNLINSIIIVGTTYLFVYVLFNENNKYNILSKQWLKNENLLNENTQYSASLKDLYYKNITSII
jgi:hypothetical protein